MMRDPTLADLPAILRAQNDAATALAAIGVRPWTADEALGRLENSLHPRGQFRIRVCELGLPGNRAVHGFTLTKQVRNPPPEPDGTELTIQLIAARVNGTPIRDRLRLRIVALQSLRDLVGHCHNNGLTWRAFTLDDPDDRFAINEIISQKDGIASGVTVEFMMREGIRWRVVRSNNPCMDPADARITWPAETFRETD